MSEARTNMERLANEGILNQSNPLGCEQLSDEEIGAINAVSEEDIDKLIRLNNQRRNSPQPNIL